MKSRAASMSGDDRRDRRPGVWLAEPLLAKRAKAGGRGRTRTYEGVSQRIYSPPPLPLGTLSRTPCMPAGTRFRMTWEWTLPVKTEIPWGLFIAADRRSVNRAGDGPRFADQAGSAWSRRTSPRRAVRPRIDRRFGRQPFPAAARPGLTNVAIFVGARAAGQVARRAENADAGHAGV